jgi:hypothetical protein
MNPDGYWSIDFLGVDDEKAAMIVEKVTELGLATSAIVADPDSFLTLHLDDDTVKALDSALASSRPSEATSRIVDSIREAILHWTSTRDVSR